MGRDIKKMTARDHILRYPEAYLGSTLPSNNNRIAFNSDEEIVNVTGYVPAAIRAFKEILDNAVDAAARDDFKSGLNIHCSFDETGFFVKDDGHGIPVKKSKEGVYMPELALGENRAGSNFESERSTIGMYGVGSYCTNVVSERLELITNDGKYLYSQIFENNCSIKNSPLIKKSPKKSQSGTLVSVVFDKKIIKWNKQSIFCCLQLLNNVMFVYPVINITASFNGKDVNLLKGNDYHIALGLDNPWFTIESDNIRGVFGLFDEQSKLKGLVNGTECTGMHLSTLKSVISSELINTFQNEIDGVIRADISKSLSGIISFRIESPNFGSLTKTDLVGCNTDKLKNDISVIIDGIKSGLTASDQFKQIICELAEKRGGKKLKAQEKKAARKRQSTKLIDVYGRRKKGEKTYLLITEGDSAKGLFVQVRNPALHAIYPLRGKILNAVTAGDVEKVANNQVLFELASIIGLSLTNNSIEDCRYDYIVALTDADPDGDSICGLIYGFLNAYWPDLFKEGKVLRLCTPPHIGISGDKRKHYYGKVPKNFKGKLEYIKGLGSLTKGDVQSILKDPRFEEVTPDDESDRLMEIVLGGASPEKRAWLE